MHPPLAVAHRGTDHVGDEATGVAHHKAAGFGDYVHVWSESCELLADQRADRLDRGRRLSELHWKTSPQVEKTRTQSSRRQVFEYVMRSPDRRAPVPGIAALAANVKRHPGHVQIEATGFLDDRINVRGTGAELAGQRPVRALVGRVDSQAKLGIRLELS